MSIEERLSEGSIRQKDDRQAARARHFVRGPIPMNWLEKAAKQPGKALAVALLLWFRYGFDPGRPVTLSGNLLDRFGIDRKAAYRALDAMGAEGLIRIDRRPGKASLVEIIKDQD